MNLSCVPPKHFMAFSRHQSLPAIQQDVDVTAPSPDFIDPNLRLSPRKITGMAISGFLLGLSGRYLIASLAGRTPVLQEAVPAIEKIAETPVSSVPQKVNIWYQFQDKLYAMFALAVREPTQIPTLLSYTATCVLGYLAGSVLQGAQEAWVRSEETHIRAQLLARLTGVVKNSIRLKYRMDNNLRQEARERIQTLLRAHGIPMPDMMENAVLEPLAETQRYFFEPTHRTIKPTVYPQFSGVFYTDTLPPKPAGIRLAEWGALGGGFILGNLCHSLIGLMKDAAREASKAQELHEKANKDFVKEMAEYISVADLEGFFVKGMNRNMKILVGLLFLTATAKMGKLWIDGLREIEVTRLNARTEYNQQNNIWMRLDTQFHDAAEREALENGLHLLQNDLPRLRQNPKVLEQRIQTLLDNIGRNSAPKYFPMIPMVGLREARS